MGNVINLLPESVANQIAAGEVVQRPSSVVKELIENAIDAGGQKIRVLIKDAGKLLIQVIDDGKGMNMPDAKMCFERHATSKIKKAEDLFSIYTKGFRGEALASIAAVAQVELKTKQAGNEVGTKVKIEGGQVKDCSEEACTDGTSIAVRNLFYNVPARRNFLKSNTVEMRHISEEFQRLAISHPEIGFELYHNDLVIHSCPKGKLSQRIVDIFGKSYQKQLAAIDEETPDIKIKGYIGKPEFARKSKGDQFLFVNNRYVKSPYLNHAIYNTYQGLITKDHYPFFAIFVEVDPKTIDINVHPTKTEIKFEDERLVYTILQSAVKKSLGINNFSQSLDFQADANFLNKGMEQPVQDVLHHENPGRKPVSGSGTSGFNPGSFKNTKPEQNWQELYKGLENEAEQPKETTGTIKFSSGLNEDNGSSDGEPMQREGNVLQVLNKFIVAQVKSGILLIDQNKAHQRVLYERYLSMLEKKFGSSQQFLFPQSIQLSPSDYSLVMELEPEIKALGFVFNDFGQNTIVLNGIPADAPTGQEKELFEGLLQSYKENKSELKIPVNENLARSLAKRSAIKSGVKMAEEEMKRIIDELFACKTPEYSPGGKKAMTILKENDITQFLS